MLTIWPVVLEMSFEEMLRTDWRMHNAGHRTIPIAQLGTLCRWATTELLCVHGSSFLATHYNYSETWEKRSDKELLLFPMELNVKFRQLSAMSLHCMTLLKVVEIVHIEVYGEYGVLISANIKLTGMLQAKNKEFWDYFQG